MKLALDEYAYLKSWIHQWEPTCKLIGLMALVFAFAQIETPYLLPWMMSTTLLVYGLSQLPLSFWLQRIRYPGLFLLGVVALLPFLSGETILWRWGMLTLRQEGMVAVVLIVSRFLSILTIGLVLFGTMPFMTTVKAMRSLGLPSILADLVLLSYRYLFELADSWVQMRRSMKLRGFQSQRRRVWVDWQALNRLAALMGTLLIRSYEQAEQIYYAMKLRGYGNQTIRATPLHSIATAALWDRVGLAVTLVVALSFVIAEVMV